MLQADGMTQPLALVLYEKLLPGSQLVNRLQDLNYRVQVISDPANLVTSAEHIKPMIVLADLAAMPSDVCAALTHLKANPTTNHLPVIAFCAEHTGTDLQVQAQAAGATLVVSDTALLNHLPQCLDQALQIE
jgi:CheY-like chemotaxis protein